MHPLLQLQLWLFLLSLSHRKAGEIDSIIVSHWVGPLLPFPTYSLAEVEPYLPSSSSSTWGGQKPN